MLRSSSTAARAGLYEDRARAAVDELRDIADNGWVRVLGSYDTEHVL